MFGVLPRGYWEPGLLSYYILQLFCTLVLCLNLLSRLPKTTYSIFSNTW